VVIQGQEEVKVVQTKDDSAAADARPSWVLRSAAALFALVMMRM
jgi:hypothetical protein